MGLKFYKPYTASTRNRSVIDFSNLSKIKPEKQLTFSNQRANGRNNKGRITIRHRGGGHKRLYRLIDFKRYNFYAPGIVKTIEYDPNRNCNIALIEYWDGKKGYILVPENLKIGDEIISGKDAPIQIGNALPLKFIPIGSEIHNIELYHGKGGQLVRAAGTSARILAKENNYVIIKLPSKEIRLIRGECYATIGKVGNGLVYKIKLGKAGRNRWLGIRPTVRGSVMNPIDHPHGGGEGRCPIGKPRPLTPWGKPALGVKTRKRNKKSDRFIIRKRS